MADIQKHTDVKLMMWEKEKIRKNVIRRARSLCSEDFKGVPGAVFPKPEIRPL